MSRIASATARGSPRRIGRKHAPRGESWREMEDLPGTLDIERHALLTGRGRHVWYRRALCSLLVVLPVLALLNVFGQKPSVSDAAGDTGTLTVQAPERVRGGLLFQVRVDVKATQEIKEPQLVLSPGLVDQLTLNTTEPDPLSQSSSNGRLTLSYGRIHAGQRLTVWLEYQANPANLGPQTANIPLPDGDKPIAIVKRDITILP